MVTASALSAQKAHLTLILQFEFGSEGPFGSLGTLTEGAPLFGSGEGSVRVTGRGYSASSDLAGTDLGSRVTFTPPRGAT